MRSTHDTGGFGSGPIPRKEYVWEEWEKRGNAIIGALRAKNIVTIDEARRHMEQLGDGYFRYSYFQRTMHSAAQMALTQGLITADELARTMERIEKEERGG